MKAQARAAQGYQKTTEQRCACCTWLRWDERINRRGRVVRGDYRCGLGNFPTGLWGWCGDCTVNAEAKQEPA